MNNTHRYIKIDPKTRTITEQFVTGVSDIGTLLADRFRKDIDCQLLECVTLSEGDLWVDEEGLLKAPNDKEACPVWLLMNGEEVLTILSGAACLCSAENGEEGVETVALSPKVTMSMVERRVRFLADDKRIGAEVFVEEILGMTTICFSLDEVAELDYQKEQLMAKAKAVLL